MIENITPAGGDIRITDIPAPSTIEQRMKNVGNLHGIRQQRGWPAIFRSIDRVSEGFFEKSANLNPDGYLVGIGAGSIFAMLQLFFHEPKGLIAADCNPGVVIAGRVMVDDLKSAPDSDSFIENFFGRSRAEYKNKVAAVLEDDSRLSDIFQAWRGWEGSAIRTPIDPPEPLMFTGYVDVREAITTHFDLLKRMALEDKIAFCLTDFADPEFISSIRNLPEYQISKNVIFLTSMLAFRESADYRVPIENIGLLDTPEDDTLFISTHINTLQHFHGFTELLSSLRLSREDLPPPTA